MAAFLKKKKSKCSFISGKKKRSLRSFLVYLFFRYVVVQQLKIKKKKIKTKTKDYGVTQLNYVLSKPWYCTH